MKINLMIIKYILPLHLFVWSPMIANCQQDTSRNLYRKQLFDFDYRRPVFKLEDEQLINRNRFLRYSALTGYREGVEPIKGLANFTSYFDKQTGTLRIYMFNLSIQDILTHGFFHSNRVILEVKDSTKYRYYTSDIKEGGIKKEEWLRTNGHCFELMMPMGIMSNGIKILDEELAHVFGVKFGSQKRMTNSLVLVRTSNKDKIRTKGNGAGSYNEKGYFNNVPLSRLGHLLNIAEMPPLVDETGYKENVDLILNINSWRDLKSLRKELQKYDLDIKQENREVEMFVITEIR